VKNEFVSFRKVTLFFYEGPDANKKSQMTLLVCSKRKRKRDNAADCEGPRIVKTRTISL